MKNIINKTKKLNETIKSENIKYKKEMDKHNLKF